MVKVQMLRFVTEVAPSKMASHVIKRPFVKMLETIKEEEASHGTSTAAAGGLSSAAGVTIYVDRSKGRAT
ncbi:OLC1v1023447C1 [Oldenlandia corymbosa var. corymbosa]|uniref:OLC1v1023447C1 n=1 Tax=Oldenlandia corymbosa var. corymbosa TaxID=529605 RepID=A0AAV1C2T0_OLDCO|nr:OLC1v1023447C1 [Oldenlandia corymbosa var. corymbosa]